jgi:hypothetical protein
MEPRSGRGGEGGRGGAGEGGEEGEERGGVAEERGVREAEEAGEARAGASGGGVRVFLRLRPLEGGVEGGSAVSVEGTVRAWKGEAWVRQGRRARLRLAVRGAGRDWVVFSSFSLSLFLSLTFSAALVGLVAGALRRSHGLYLVFLSLCRRCG